MLGNIKAQLRPGSGTDGNKYGQFSIKAQTLCDKADPERGMTEGEGFKGIANLTARNC